MRFLAFLSVAAVLGACSKTDPRDDLGADEMKALAANMPTGVISEADVPARFRDLIPLAKKWGVGDDGIRDDLIEKSTDADKWELINALRGKTADLRMWLDSHEDGEMSDAAAAFMYMSSALAEIGVWPDVRVVRTGVPQAPSGPSDPIDYLDLDLADTRVMKSYVRVARALVSNVPAEFTAELRREIEPWVRDVGADTVAFERHVKKRFGAGEAVLVLLKKR